MQIGKSMRMESGKITKMKKEREIRRRMQKLKDEKGITLLALILTVVIMIILAAVTINVALGEGGIVDQAKWAAEQTANSTKAEQEQLKELEQEFANLMAEDSEVTPPEPEEPSVPESTSYVGYYADVDGNGSVDGVIYADLAIGGSGSWGGYKYEIPKESNFKKYKISQKNYSEKFGTMDVLTMSNEDGNKRFYVMALKDINSTKYYWYQSAYGNMSDFSSTTSTDFGKGQQNTKNIISKWNSSIYGSQNSNDIWGVIKKQIEEGWYVPSRDEWQAFANAFNIKSSNYNSTYGFLGNCWSSSQSDVNSAWNIRFNNSIISNDNVFSSLYIRLSTTF